MGNDLSVVNAARVSFGNTSKSLSDKDKKLINYLAKHQHFSPFEHCTATMLVECPLYIRSQIMRHRTFAYNEISRRYTAENLEFYMPEKLRKQHSTSRQCSDGNVDPTCMGKLRMEYTASVEVAYQTYNVLLDSGVARETARGVLPQCLMTKFYMSGNLRNWLHFIKLRIDSHAQVEAQEIASKVLAHLKKKFPVSVVALMELE
jgi:thymidylate synthase (FAD)